MGFHLGRRFFYSKLSHVEAMSHVFSPYIIWAYGGTEIQMIGSSFLFLEIHLFFFRGFIVGKDIPVPFCLRSLDEGLVQ